MTRIGILSDTHDHIEHTKWAVNVFKQNAVSQLIHCGDFCSPFMMSLLKDIPTTGIFGNNDGDLFLLQKKATEFTIDLKGGFWESEIEGIKFAVYHGTYEPITQALIKSEMYDLVLSGHTHQVVNEKIGKTVHINPGSTNGFSLKPSVVLIDFPTLHIQVISKED